MRLFPAFFYMDDVHVVVFGGGEEARRKVRLLARTPAHITVIVGTDLEPGFAEEFSGRITIAPQDQTDTALDRAKFAIIACRLDENREKALIWTRQYGIPVNVVDHPELCDFTVPSILDRGEIVAAVGSGGAAPVLAKRVRTQLEALLPHNLGRLSEMARDLRPAVQAALDTGMKRRQFWEAALNGAPADLALGGQFEAAQVAFEDMLAGFAVITSPALRDADGQSAHTTGPVHIVGAGPGDPELLTLKAFRLIQNADIVFHDRLVSDEVMNLVRRDAVRVSVGKAKADHSVPQDEIHTLMIAAARTGQRVVRLKGGDPFIFGRGGEELQALRDAGIEAQVVPGISAALGCAASAGLPLTHRDHAQSLTFVTGHASSSEVPDLDWTALARANQTVVVFMGVGTAHAIASALMTAGRAPTTPVAVIENGTRTNEIKVFGTLAELAQLIEQAGIKGPALLVIGEVAGIPAQVKARTSRRDIGLPDGHKQTAQVSRRTTRQAQGEAAVAPALEETVA